MRTHPLRRSLAAAVVLAALAGPPGGAAASSIVYTDGPDVWIASPDGARRAQVTHAPAGDLGYATPSQADDGTIVALDAGNRLVRFAQSGRRIGDPVPLWLGDGRSNGFHGPFDPQVSPDGSKVAYAYNHCPAGDDCFRAIRRFTAYTYASRYTDLAELGHFPDWTEPSWIDSSRTLAFNPGAGSVAGLASIGWNAVGADPPGGYAPLFRWFDDPVASYPQIGALSRQGDKLAVAEGLEGPKRIVLYDVPAAPPNAAAWEGPAPQGTCELGAAGKPLTHLSWAPDGSALAFELDGGVWVLPVGDLSRPACGDVAPPVRIANGLAPFWGPKDVGADAGSDGGGNGGGAAPAPRPAPPGPLPRPSPVTPIARTRARPAAVAVARGQRLRSALARGLRVTVRPARPGRVAVTASVDRATARRLRLRPLVARATATASARSGVPVVATLRFTPAARRALGRLKTARLTLAVSGVRETATATLRR